jgi:hypothetical protein
MLVYAKNNNNGADEAGVGPFGLLSRISNEVRNPSAAVIVVIFCRNLILLC